VAHLHIENTVKQEIGQIFILKKTKIKAGITNGRFAVLHLGGRDTAHGGTPRLVSPPTSANL